MWSVLVLRCTFVTDAFFDAFLDAFWCLLMFFDAFGPVLVRFWTLVDNLRHLPPKNLYPRKNLYDAAYQLDYLETTEIFDVLESFRFGCSWVLFDTFGHLWMTLDTSRLCCLLLHFRSLSLQAWTLDPGPWTLDSSPQRLYFPSSWWWYLDIIGKIQFELLHVLPPHFLLLLLLAECFFEMCASVSIYFQLFIYLFIMCVCVCVYVYMYIYVYIVKWKFCKGRH